MNIIKMMFVAVVLVAIVACADAVERSAYPCHRLAQVPVIDGKMDDEAWKNIPESAGFYILILKKESAEKYAFEKQTYFKAGWTEGAIYLLIRAEESAPEKMIAKAKDNGNVFEDDSIELFLFPLGAPTYTHLAVNSVGSRFAKRGSEDINLLDWEAKTVVGKTEWMLELRIPFAVLAGKAPKEWDEWPANMARNILTGPAENRYTSWSLLKTGFHDLPNFGRFTFKGIAGDKVIAEEKEINRAYVQGMHGELKKLAGMAEKYEQALGEAQKSDDQRVAAEAGDLLQTWKQVVKLAGQSDLDLRELATAYRACGNLCPKSDDCIARGMLEMLLKE